MASKYSLYNNEQDRNQAVNKVTYFNLIFGIPLIGMVIYMLIAGKLENWKIISYVAIGVLVLGVVYSLWKIIESRRNSQ